MDKVYQANTNTVPRGQQGHLITQGDLLSNSLQNKAAQTLKDVRLSLNAAI